MMFGVILCRFNKFQPLRKESTTLLKNLEDLVERIIKASSNPGDLVFDCFMGSGTTQAVAMKLGRRFIGADINLGAVETTTKRLLKVASEIQENTVQEEIDTQEQDPGRHISALYGL